MKVIYRALYIRMIGITADSKAQLQQGGHKTEET